jgi:hypothetical protein
VSDAVRLRADSIAVIVMRSGGERRTGVRGRAI